MRRRTGPVQQWVDSIPSPIKPSLAIASECQGVLTQKVANPMTPTEPKNIPFPIGTKTPTMTVSAPINVPNIPLINTPGLPSSLPHKLVRDTSLQSDSSHCSSVESLLELRKADPEAILLSLGFGGCPSSPQENGSLSRIPKRFLQPSKLKGIAINDFVKHQQETSESFDSVSLGYRGLTGSPYVAPSEIVKKIMQRLREHESHEYDSHAGHSSCTQDTPQHNGSYSVLSPDNRQFLERPRSKSPDMRNKRIIIGQKSFAFGHDGDLIEIKSDEKESSESNLNNDSMVENSEISRNTEDISTDRSKLSADVVCNTERMIPKQLLFDDSIELSDTDISSPTKTSKQHLDKQNASLDENTDCKDGSLNMLLQNVSDVRRASDGSCDVKAGENPITTQGRRHSDGFVHRFKDGSSESIVSQRRKTLKRQTRVSELDAISYDSETSVSNTVQCRESNSHEKANTSENNTNVQTKSVQNLKKGSTSRNKESCSAAECSNEFPSTMDDSIKIVDSSLIHENQKDNCECCVEKNQIVGRSRKDDEKTCSCSGTTKYWAKMDKILKKNKNLENMVARNRREMAEIREMLSSVLSVRLEPGF